MKKPTQDKSKAKSKTTAKTPITKKKTTSPKLAETSQENLINFKSVGQNVILIIDNEKYSKKIEDKEIRASLKEKVEKYNTKPTKSLKTTILKEMLPKEKEKVLKKELVLTPEEKLEAAKKLLADSNYKIVAKEEPKKVPSSYGGRREY